MTTPRPVTEADFRMPEYRGAETKDYEWREDGVLVRKDRWETGIHRIRSLLEISPRNFEITEVVDAVSRLIESQRDWNELDVDSGTFLDFPDHGALVDVRLLDGSLLTCATYSRLAPRWTWREDNYATEVVAWRDYVAPEA